MTTWMNSQRCTKTHVFRDVFMIFQHVELCSLIPKGCKFATSLVDFSYQGEIIRRKTASRQSREGNGLSAYLRYSINMCKLCDQCTNRPTELLGSDINIHHRCGKGFILSHES